MLLKSFALSTGQQQNKIPILFERGITSIPLSHFHSESSNCHSDPTYRHSEPPHCQSEPLHCQSEPLHCQSEPLHCHSERSEESITTELTLTLTVLSKGSSLRSERQVVWH